MNDVWRKKPLVINAPRKITYPLYVNVSAMDTPQSRFLTQAWPWNQELLLSPAPTKASD